VTNAAYYAGTPQQKNGKQHVEGKIRHLIFVPID
jgi:hypothetical protein